ncbi:bifunctional nuclease family protein, partial [Hyphomicrobium sp.]|uniref:bifunctional nuclease family protein n=1 Tax=Hyphomicrobium sp. TaxID=82 RepID=UPI001E06104B
MSAFAKHPYRFIIAILGSYRWSHIAILASVIAAVTFSVSTQYGLKKLVDALSNPSQHGAVWIAFAMVIGFFEASSIDRHVRGQTTPRPLTHDLLVSVVEGLGATLQDVVITELREHVYYARLRVRHDGELVEIDARPSDAIAVAVACDPP